MACGQCAMIWTCGLGKNVNIPSPFVEATSPCHDRVTRAHFHTGWLRACAERGFENCCGCCCRFHHGAYDKGIEAFRPRMSHRSAFSERVFHENAGVYTGAITANLFLGWCDANMYVNTVMTSARARATPASGPVASCLRSATGREERK